MDQKSPKHPSTPSQETPVQMNCPPPAAGVTPDRLTVPEAFSYPEMYKSPTDQIMSPISKRLLARTKSNNKSSGLLPSTSTTSQQHKIQASKFQDHLGALKP